MFTGEKVRTVAVLSVDSMSGVLWSWAVQVERWSVEVPSINTPSSCTTVVKSEPTKEASMR